MKQQLKDLNEYVGLSNENYDMFMIGFKDEKEFKVLKEYLKLDLVYDKYKNINLLNKQYVSSNDMITLSINRIWFLDFFDSADEKVERVINTKSSYHPHNERAIDDSCVEANSDRERIYL